MANSRYTYLLGDSRREVARLRKQAQLWDPVTAALFDRLRIKPGMRVLEIGPGGGSIHLELRRRVQGPVDAVERSEVFVQRLGRLCGRDGFGDGQIWQSDLLEADLPANHYDVVFARWVFLFLPDPLAHLRKLVRSLRPGGRIALQDYLRGTLSLVPAPNEWADLLAADRAFFASQGGDGNVGAGLPALYKKAGMELLEVVPTVKWGHPGSPVWDWVSTYFFGVMSRLSQMKPLTPASGARLLRHWKRAAEDHTSLLVAPTLLDVVGRKPRARALRRGQ